MIKAWVIDTPVVVAGLLTKRDDAPAARILDRMLCKQFPFVLSNDLLAEYRAVLLRQRTQARHRLHAAEVDFILTDLARNAIMLEPAADAAAAPEPGAQKLWNLLASRDDLGLVSEDKGLLKAKNAPGLIMDAQQFTSSPSSYTH